MALNQVWYSGLIVTKSTFRLIKGFTIGNCVSSGGYPLKINTGGVLITPEKIRKKQKAPTAKR